MQERAQRIRAKARDLDATRRRYGELLRSVDLQPCDAMAGIDGRHPQDDYSIVAAPCDQLRSAVSHLVTLIAECRDERAQQLLLAFIWKAEADRLHLVVLVEPVPDPLPTA